MINVQKAYTYMVNKYDIQVSSNGWYSFECPFHHTSGSTGSQMMVNFNHRRVKCWGATCTFGEDFLDTFIAEVEDLKSPSETNNFLKSFDETKVTFQQSTTKRKKFVAGNDVILPKGFLSISETKKHLGKNAARYLTNRGFDIDYLDYKGFGYCNQTGNNFEEDFYGYLIIPFQSSEREFNYYIGRNFIDKDSKFKYKNPSLKFANVGKSTLLYNAPALKTAKKLFVHEGWACAETVGKQAVATLGWKISPDQKAQILNSKADEIVIVPDVGFYEKAVAQALDFIDYKKVKVLNFDTLQEFGNDTNDVGKEKMLDLYEKTDYLDLPTIIDIIY